MLTKKRAGYIEMVSPKEPKYEADTCTCKHCNRAWIVRSTRKGEGDLGGWCLKCQAPICPTCADKGCYPFEEQLLKYERKQQLFSEMGL